MATEAPRAVTIRRATPEDARAVTLIYVESSNAAFAKHQPPRTMTEELVGRWAADLTSPRHEWWLAEADSAPVGFAGIGPSRDPVDPRVGELDTIAVLPALWRRGVGRSLMRVVDARLDELGYDEAVLWTWRDDDRTYGFYRSAGWWLTEQTRNGDRQVCFRRPNGGA